MYYIPSTTPIRPASTLSCQFYKEKCVVMGTFFYYSLEQDARL